MLAITLLLVRRNAYIIIRRCISLSALAKSAALICAVCRLKFHFSEKKQRGKFTELLAQSPLFFRLSCPRQNQVLFRRLAKPDWLTNLSMICSFGIFKPSQNQFPRLFYQFLPEAQAADYCVRAANIIHRELSGLW